MVYSDLPAKLLSMKNAAKLLSMKNGPTLKQIFQDITDAAMDMKPTITLRLDGRTLSGIGISGLIHLAQQARISHIKLCHISKQLTSR